MDLQNKNIEPSTIEKIEFHFVIIYVLIFLLVIIIVIIFIKLK